jgi:phage-related protein
MVKAFVIIGLFLVLAGGPALYWCSLQAEQAEQRTSACKYKYKHDVEEYAKKFTAASSEDDTSDLIFPPTAYLEKMTQSQRQQAQQERLFADIEELAESAKSPSPDADLLYGSGWRQQVADFKKDKQLRTTVQVASVTAVASGGVLLATAVIFLIVRGIIWLIGLIIRPLKKTNRQEDPHKKVVQAPVQSEGFTQLIPNSAPRPSHARSSPPAISQASSPPPSGPTAEEFRKALLAQTESLKETAEELKQLAVAWQQHSLEHEQNLAKRLENDFSKAQAEGLKQEGELLKKLVGNIQESAEIRLDKLSKTIEGLAASQTAAIENGNDELRKSNTAALEKVMRQYGDELNGIRQQVGELTHALQATTSPPDNTKEICKQLEREFKSQRDGFSQEGELVKKLISNIQESAEIRLDKLSKTIEGLAASQTAAIENGNDELRKSNAAVLEKAMRRYSDELNGIRQQVGELTHALQATTSPPDNTKEICEQLERGFKSQTDGFKRESEVLKKLISNIEEVVETNWRKLFKTIEDSTASQTAAIKNEKKELQETANAAWEEAMQGYNDEVRDIRRQIEELSQAIQSASPHADTKEICEQLDKLINITGIQNEELKKEVEPLKDILSKLEQTMEESLPRTQNDTVSHETDEQLQQETKLVRQISEEALQKSGDISKNIVDLTEQVCAIRDYAATQQHHLARLQDGYDWNIIKNFCLRVIRCIDNLDDKITGTGGNGGSALNTEHLSAVRDELVFILESNGVEPFGARINSDYRGQESRLQVLNEREETDDRELFGKIAQVVRPGYQCRVNDEYTKIVRPAHVRLYGPISLSKATVRGI